MNVNQTQMLDCLIASLEGPSEVATYQNAPESRRLQAHG